MTRDELVEAIATAIARMEGFYNPKSIASRNKNPGNLRTWGKQPTNAGFAVFDTVQDGFKALRKQISINVFRRGLSLREFFAGKPGVYPGYAPASDGNRPVQYARFVASQIGRGTSIDIPIKNLVDGENQ